MPTATENLRTLLQQNASIQASETGLDATLQDVFVAAALAEHNYLYTAETLPARETELVIMLAWMRVARWRAQEAARNGDLQTPSGYGQDRQSPVTANLKIVESLRKQYDSLCAQMGLESAVQTGTVNVSNNRVMDARIDVPVPLASTPVPPTAILAQTAVDGDTTSVIVSWTVPPMSDFYSYTLVHVDSSITIYQPWNSNSSTGIPFLNNNANLFDAVLAREVKALKVEGLNRAVVNKFLLVVRNTSNLYSYSAELVVAAIP